MVESIVDLKGKDVQSQILAHSSLLCRGSDLIQMMLEEFDKVGVVGDGTATTGSIDFIGLQRCTVLTGTSTIVCNLDNGVDDVFHLFDPRHYCHLK